MSAALANQIAAGEVVERPASCLKELIDNSLDAGATTIRIMLEEGGIASMLVQDDGCGMDAEDAILAFSRHATSKLLTQRDLFKIATLGFRGEALASIAAVAKVRLETRTAESLQGVAVEVWGTDERTDSAPVGMPPGTKIQVRELFYNTPARLKYLRTVATEQARCVEVVQKAALARAMVAFRCEINGHIVFQSTGKGRPLDVLAALYGVGEVKQLLPFEELSSDYRIRGWIGRPTQAKSNRSHGHLFINGRPIRNLAIQQAVAAGYGGRLMVNRHPIYALYIDMDPTLVDVNIHPHKAEVRFSEERDLCQIIQNTVRRTLDETFLVHGVHFETQRKMFDSAVQTSLPVHSEQSARSPDSASGHSQSPRTQGIQRGTFRTSNASYANDGRGQNRHFNEAEVASALEATLLREPSARTASFPEQTAPPNPEKRPVDWRLRPVGQSLGMYVIADDGNHMYIIDQHAAHERVLYERFVKRMQQQAVQSIPLLTPLPMTLSPSLHAVLQGRLPALATLGLTFEQFGGYDVVLRTIPAIWEGLDYAKLAQDVVDTLAQERKAPEITEVLREVIVMRACKAAIKANWYLSNIEMQALCDALTGLDDPFHCPHGRPVFIRLSSHELEKMFGRIV